MSPFVTGAIQNPRLHTAVAAFFDVDNTLLPGEASEVRFFRHLWKHGVVGWRETLQSLGWLARHIPPISLSPLRERKLYLGDKQVSDIEPLAEEFCRTVLLPALSKNGLAKLDEHRRAGHHLVLVTGSVDFLIMPLALLLEVDTVLAAKLERRGNTYTGHLLPPLPYGEGKRELIVALARDLGIELGLSYAYGDSPGDADILKLVGHPLVVNPIRGMARVARRQGWAMARWE
ncbi:MAG: HAD family hydrolase [Nitrospiraceae bacterium]